MDTTIDKEHELKWPKLLIQSITGSDRTNASECIAQATRSKGTSYLRLQQPKQ